MNDLTINMFDPAMRENPFPIYHRMRDEMPVCRVDPGGIYALTRYDDVAAAFRDTATQFDYFLNQCARLPATPDTATRGAPAAGATAAPGFSVQVAAYSARRQADALAARLKARGFDVRVAHLPGGQVPYRVRIGRYATRADATAALRRVRNAGLNGIVVEAEPR